MQTNDKEDREDESPLSLASTEANASDGNINPLDLVEPENTLPDIELGDLPAIAQAAAANAGWTTSHAGTGKGHPLPLGRA